MKEQNCAERRENKRPWGFQNVAQAFYPQNTLGFFQFSFISELLQLALLSLCHHSLQISLVPRHNKMTRVWDCRDVPVYWVFTRHMSSFCCFSFPSIFPVVPTAAALTPLQNFRQAHLLLPVWALLSAKKRHVNIDWKSLMKSSQAVLRKSCDRLFPPGVRKST